MLQGAPQLHVCERGALNTDTCTHFADTDNNFSLTGTIDFPTVNFTDTCTDIGAGETSAVMWKTSPRMHYQPARSLWCRFVGIVRAVPIQQLPSQRQRRDC